MKEDNTPAIQVRGLTKSFDRVEAVCGIDFEVRPGELFGFLGPNGAGKTTTIKMLTGLARPDSGSITISGIDITGKTRGAQHLIGVVPDESNLYPELTGFENLCFCASLYGLGRQEREKRAKQLLQDFDLFKAADRKFGGYSKGMKRKLTIAAGIIHRPRHHHGHGQRLCPRHHGRFFYRFIRACLVCLYSGGGADCGGIDLSRSFYCGSGDRSLRGADLFQLLQISDDVSLRALLSRC